MINYIWIGLIIIAVVYAAYRDIRQDPASYTHDPVPAEVWTADDEAWGEVPVAPEVVWEHPEWGELPAVRLSYDFAERNRMDIGFRTQLQRTASDTDVPVEELHLRVKGEGQGHRLRAEFEDANGERFFAALSRNLPSTDEWVRVHFPLTGLTPGPDNPTATPAWPLTLQSLIIIRNPGAEEDAGEVFMAGMSYWYGRVYRAGPDFETERWTGVITASFAKHAGGAISIAISLIGIMMFWLGLMKIAEKAGLVRLIARALKPIMTRLFPDLPPEGPAMGAIVMNISANMLGLGNAATPLGLKAMEEMQKVNPHKEYASNAMCMLLALNTSSVTLITATVIGLRYAAGSTDLMLFWPVMILTTMTSTIVGVLTCKILERLPIFQIPRHVREANGREGAET